MVRFAIEDPTSADARWCFNLYFAELNRRFEEGFDPGLSISAGPQELTPPMGLLLLARLHGQPIACGALKFHQRRPAELKRMWIAPAERGAGVARRLLGELERTAREAGAVVSDLRQTEHSARQSHFTNVQVMSKLRRSTPNPMPTTGSKKRLGRKSKVGKCNNRD
jgi:GNAT superfamily N-acetyltransferase